MPLLQKLKLELDKKEKELPEYNYLINFCMDKEWCYLKKTELIRLTLTAIQYNIELRIIVIIGSIFLQFSNSDGEQSLTVELTR